MLNLVKTKLQKGKGTTFWVKSQIYADNEATGIIQPSPLLENDEDLLICPALSSTQNNKHMVAKLTNFWTTLTQSRKEHIVEVTILTPEQTQQIRLANTTLVGRLLNNNHDGAIQYLYNLLKTSKTDEVNKIY